MEADLGVRESSDQLPGIDLGDGNIKTSRGTIRTPKSRLRQTELLKQEVEAVHSPEPKVTVKTTPVTIHSDFGDIIYDCIEIIKTGKYLVLEMVNNNFSPKAYNEAPDLRLPISWENNSGSYVFTGCKWKHQRTLTNFIVLLEVTDDVD